MHIYIAVLLALQQKNLRFGCRDRRDRQTDQTDCRYSLIAGLSGSVQDGDQNVRETAQVKATGISDQLQERESFGHQSAVNGKVGQCQERAQAAELVDGVGVSLGHREKRDRRMSCNAFDDSYDEPADGPAQLQRNHGSDFVDVELTGQDILDN